MASSTSSSSSEVHTDNLVYVPSTGSGMNPLRIYHPIYLINAGPPLAVPGLRKRPLQRQHAIIIYLDEIVSTLVPTFLDNPEPETRVTGGFGGAVFSEPSGALTSDPDANNYTSSFHDSRRRDRSARFKYSWINGVLEKSIQTH